MKFLLSLVILLIALPAYATISFDGNGRWDTTFDCTEVSYPSSVSCDGLGGWGGPGNNPTNVSAITSSANNTSGDGGNGIRFWVDDGTNVLTAPIYAYFPSPQQHFWMRWTERWETGATWSGGSPSYTKSHYIRTTNGDPSGYSGFFGTGYRIYNQGGSGDYPYTATGGWNTVYPTGTSDGSWHTYEIEMQMDTSGANGIGRIWIDGVLLEEDLTVNWSNGNTTARLGWVHTLFRHNQATPNNGEEIWIDYDDMVIYVDTPPNTDSYGNPFIGLVGPDTTPPSVSSTSPYTDEINVTPNSTITANYDEYITCASPTVTVTGATVGSIICNANVLTIPVSNQDMGTEYPVSINGVYDIADTPNEQTVAHTFSYTTAFDSTLPIKVTNIFSESFEDNNWTARSWYDGTTSTGSTAGGYIGNGLKWTWASSATRPTGFTAIRNNLDSSVTEFMVEYYVKFESNWQGSGQNYHPHYLHLLSTEATAYQSLARNYSALYFEVLSDTSSPYNTYVAFQQQDYYRVNAGFGTPPQDLTSTTEDRSANHCNSPYTLSGATIGICYADGGGWYSSNGWTATSNNIALDTWTKVTTYIKKNTYTEGVANFDGIVRIWIGETLVIESTTVLYATNAHNDTEYQQIVLAPWIGDGSPTAQTMWIDELSAWLTEDQPTSVVGTGVSVYGVGVKVVNEGRSVIQ